MNIPVQAILIVALFGVVAGVSAASAQTAPGASAEMSLMSSDLTSARTSAISMKTQGDQFRQQKLAALQAAAAGVNQPLDPAAAMQAAATIPNGGGLVTGQTNHTVISDFLADTAGIAQQPTDPVRQPAELVDIEIADPR